MTGRYALYFSPPKNSPLSAYGEAILGRSAKTPKTAQSTSSFTNNARWRGLTEKPAHYGFHATLKAPFSLNPRHSEAELLQAVEDFALTQNVQQLPGLKPRNLSQFSALTVDEQPNTLRDFAFACVESFEAFRQPLSKADTQRRMSRSLSARQLVLMQRFGYPYVADEFHFHMTLSGTIQESDTDFFEWLISMFNAMVPNEPLLDQISIFRQKDRQTPFTLLANFALQNS